MERTAPEYVGLTEDEARALAADQDRPFRVVNRDGEDFIVTADYVERRINVTVRENRVLTAERY